MTKFAIAAYAGRGARSGLILPVGTMIGFAIAIVAVFLMTVFSLTSLQSRANASEKVTQSLQVLEQIQGLLSTLKDAETGQRGFLLTGEDRYLEPYENARAEIPGELNVLRRLLPESEQMQQIDTIGQAITEKLDELALTIEKARANDRQGALMIVNTERGRLTMDRIRSLLMNMSRNQHLLLDEQQKDWQEAAQFSVLVTIVGCSLLLILIIAAAVMTSRDYLARETQVWLRTGQTGFNTRIQGEQRLDRLGDNVLEFLAEYLDAQVGAVYIRERGGLFRRVAGYALAPGDEGEILRSGDGLLGQAAKENRAIHVRNVPEAFLNVTSSVGRGKTQEVLLAPASIDGVVHAVIELGFLHKVGPADHELLMRISESLAVAVRASRDRTRLEELLEETQRQAEELQTQQEELRVNNEELEEQGRALRESRGQLEAQQAELEQTNSQLEEQAQMLERQKDNLTQSQAILSERATELERANQYKSEFLANMSHELRTPLNSSLILAKLLSENRHGNLTEEQVKFATTISAAGNDLLVLINDILDLSKIESGKVEVEPESVFVARTVDSLVRSLQPTAQQKGLNLSLLVEPGTPERIETDSQRFGQILKNLLSNALKFTEHGEVSLRVFSSGDGSVSFAVRDTGIGIPEHQQSIIFEAFRQADGSTHRKYGGTGLGLSISRNLALLLGGDITVQSTAGQGSVFTLTLPTVYAGSAEILPPVAAPEAPPRPAPAPDRIQGTPRKSQFTSSAVDDDRDHLEPNARLILVIEDDERFAEILRDMAHEMGFQCVVTHSAGEGLDAATRYRPSAIVLDMNLPDHSGLGVLDQLKRNSKTRHIPVHVASVADYSQEALELGAVGYALKPVKREELVGALKLLEAKFSQSLHRVLIVEDDARQRDSMRQLLGNDEVEIIGAATASEALTHLQTTTFDCIVMDLNLPDLSGYELLEQMAGQEEVSFPPVIVYTGRALTRDEEQRLRRYSKSIIIKDARSPERLLDEVTLFLHQVESTLPPERQRMLREARDRDATLEGRRILVVEDDVRNIFALSSVLEPKGVKIEVARNGREAIDALALSQTRTANKIDLVLMDIMMPEMDGMTAMYEIRKRPEWKKLPIIALTAKAMKDDQEKCLAAGANDYIAKPLDVEKLLSLVRVWMPK